MKRDVIKKETSSFLSVEKDLFVILNKIFSINNIYHKDIKKVLVANDDDVLSNPNSPVLNAKANSMNVADLIREGYVRLAPKIELGEHAEIKSYIIISFDDFTDSDNPEFRDNFVVIDVLCHTDYWLLDNFQLRPFKIMGYIDGAINNQKLTGIGKLQFVSAKQLVLNNEFSGYEMYYRAVHGSDDQIEATEIILDNPEV